MLSSIHPLGERARQNRWTVTVMAFSVGALLSGAAVGLVLGATGSAVLPESSEVALTATAVVALAAGSLDLAGVRAPGSARQVNETWIGAFRGWVYGGGFGLELGLGFLTYVVTWAVYAMYLSAVLTASPWAGALVGATFGLGRSASVIAAGFVDRPSRLTSFNRALAKAGPVVRTASAVTIAVLGSGVIVGGLL
ncbi:MAG TPA: sulfite exporter TauE/SafE family protein [Acidimicrobiia bacterium]|nr:sulfite exporter TauE/SafE family protein [Acidimicrobiia bacterium]